MIRKKLIALPLSVQVQGNILLSAKQLGRNKVRHCGTGVPESEINRATEGNSTMTTTNFRLIAAICLASIVALSHLDQDGQASNNVKRERAIASKNKDNVSRSRKGVASSVKEEVDDEEEIEKIGEDIALLKLDDKVYWNRFLQSSGSMAESPSAAPSMEDGDDDDDDDGEYHVD